MNNLPSGTVTFLFTDIEGSTKLAQAHPDAMAALLARHNEILNQAVKAHNGFIFRVTGDSFSASFHDANDALRAALDTQRLLHNEAWSPAPIKVRMGIHTGAAQLEFDSKDNLYSGYATLALTQRIMSVGHGGQILLSQSTYDLTRDRLPEKAQLVDMGERQLKDILRPEGIYQLSVTDLPSDFPPLNTLESFLHNLPTQLTSFVGREKQIDEIKALLNSSRLVTLTGSGGTGKTRLSIKVGTQELASFANGVWLIELAPLADPSQIIPTIAQAFGLQEHPFAPLASLVIDYLRDKKLLLILDNCEHLIEACARLADDFLHQCAGLKILASSREALGIAGEITYHTPSLADAESTRLFVERARIANPKFNLTDSNATSIAQICSRLDGIPLAIELAAARTKLLSPEQIAARLDDHFRLLVGGSRTALPRQQTLRALIDWSYNLLSEEEKQLLRNASVFVGGWTLDAIEVVADDPNVLEHLEQLVNKSLVVTEEHENEMRYFMLETIRQYAREKLFDANQASVARDRHFVYFDELSEKLWNEFRSTDIAPIIKNVENEVENFRAALEWGLENQTEENVRLAANYCAISSLLGTLAEGFAVTKIAVDRAKALPPVDGDAHVHRQKLIARALFTHGMIGLGVGNMPVVIETLKEAIAISRVTGDKQMLGYSLEMYFTASMFINAPGGVEAAQEGLEIFSHEVRDNFGLGMSYLNLSRIASRRGDENEREKYFGKVRDLIHEIPGSFQVGMFFLGMGMDERVRGNYTAAKKILEEGLNIFQRIGNTNFTLIMQSELGHLERQTGNLTQARLIYQDTIVGWQDLGNRSAIAHQLECFGFLAIHDEEPQRAPKLFGTAEALRERIQSPMTDYERVEYDQAVAQVRSLLTEAEFNALWAEGRSMSMEQAIEYSLRERFEIQVSQANNLNMR
jgi:predicted ATPase/class 3 adenylate cyclase